MIISPKRPEVVKSSSETRKVCAGLPAEKQNTSLGGAERCDAISSLGTRCELKKGHKRFHESGNSMWFFKPKFIEEGQCEKHIEQQPERK